MSRTSDPSPSIIVSTLDISFQPQSQKGIESIIIKAGAETRQVQPTISLKGIHHESFSPPLEVSLDTNVVVTVHYRRAFYNAVSISTDPRDVWNGAVEEDGKLVYRKAEREIEVAIGARPQLPSTVCEIMASCSRFRVLIIGDSGVGKSSLINKVFGVAGVNVSDTRRGQASINQEYVAHDNMHFVVHDSCGFEAADGHSLAVARDFISRRRRERALKDQLHAVWLCLATPFAGGRLLEAGVEQFLKGRREILGNIPLVVVFTKFDLLVNKLKMDLPGSQAATLDARTQASFSELCLTPLMAAAGSVPYVYVSTIRGYENTFTELVCVTTENVQKYIKDDAAQHVATIAQRVNMSLKVDLTMSVGEKKYWNTLMASPNFRGHTLKACLDVIHKDIVAVWNFNTTDNILLTDNFRAGLLATPNLRVRESRDRDLQRTVQSSVSLIAALVTIVASVAGTGGAALPIVVPVAGVAVLAKVASDIYNTSQDVVRQFMAYIVDLTCVMQAIFLLVSAQNIPVNAKVVGMAMRAYEETHRSAVHAAINDFKVNLAIAPGRRDEVLEKIKKLIEHYRVKDEGLLELKRRLSECRA